MPGSGNRGDRPGSTGRQGAGHSPAGRRAGGVGSRASSMRLTDAAAPDAGTRAAPAGYRSHAPAEKESAADSVGQPSSNTAAGSAVVSATELPCCARSHASGLERSAAARKVAACAGAGRGDADGGSGGSSTALGVAERPIVSVRRGGGEQDSPGSRALDPLAANVTFPAAMREEESRASRRRACQVRTCGSGAASDSESNRGSGRVADERQHPAVPHTPAAAANLEAAAGCFGRLAARGALAAAASAAAGRMPVYPPRGGDAGEAVLLLWTATSGGEPEFSEIRAVADAAAGVTGVERD